MSAAHHLGGLYPSYISTSGTGAAPKPVRSSVTLGALSDSFYEYLFKLHLLTADELALQVSVFFDDIQRALKSACMLDATATSTH